MVAGVAGKLKTLIGTFGAAGHGSFIFLFVSRLQQIFKIRRNFYRPEYPVCAPLYSSLIKSLFIFIARSSSAEL